MLNLETSLYICNLHLFMKTTLNTLFFLVKPGGSVGYVQMRMISKNIWRAYGHSYTQEVIYLKHIVLKGMKKYKFTNINRVKKQKKPSEITFMVTCNSFLQYLPSLINKHLKILYTDEDSKKALTPSPRGCIS